MRRLTAFTIAESIAALVVTALVMVLINFSLTALGRVNQHSLNQTTDWYIFLHELESPRHHFVLKEVRRRELIVTSPVNNLQYQLHGRDAFYLTAVNRGGYLRLLDNIKGDRYSFRRLSGERVLVEVERTNGEQETGIVQFYQK